MKKLLADAKLKTEIKGQFSEVTPLKVQMSRDHTSDFVT